MLQEQLAQPEAYFRLGLHSDKLGLLLASGLTACRWSISAEQQLSLCACTPTVLQRVTCAGKAYMDPAQPGLYANTSEDICHPEELTLDQARSSCLMSAQSSFMPCRRASGRRTTTSMRCSTCRATLRSCGRRSRLLPASIRQVARACLRTSPGAAACHSHPDQYY